MRKISLNCKKENGITLITLVVTLIILIILSTVTLNATLGDNGLIRQAQKALDYQANAIYSDSLLTNQTVDYFGDILEGNSTGGGWWRTKNR